MARQDDFSVTVLWCFQDDFSVTVLWCFQDEYSDDFSALGCRPVIVSFGVREGAQRWLEETECPFPMMLDVKRQIYHMFGLTRSVYKVWNISCMVFYGEQMRAGKKLPSPYENVHDDVNQMGGDFILSTEGRLILSHPSQSSTDRPTMDVLLSALKTADHSV
ncbi:hypothetical protein ACOMHN_003811 [Nucella lapillus]